MDSVESLIASEEEMAVSVNCLEILKIQSHQYYVGYRRDGLEWFESQHRKVTYRMKYRWMYWSLKGIYAMARMIL